MILHLCGMNHFQRNLEFLMRRQNETQASVAEFVGVTQPAVSNWLRDTTPRPEQLEKIAQLFAVTLNDLVQSELPHRENIEALTELERELEKLKVTWDAIPKRLKEAATNLAERRDYSGAVQNDWMASGIESCSKELSEVLEVYFSDNRQNTTMEQPSENNDPS